MQPVEVIVTEEEAVLSSLQWLKMQSLQLEQLLPLVQQLFVLVNSCSY